MSTEALQPVPAAVRVAPDTLLATHAEVCATGEAPSTVPRQPWMFASVHAGDRCQLPASTSSEHTLFADADCTGLQFTDRGKVEEDEAAPRVFSSTGVLRRRDAARAAAFRAGWLEIIKHPWSAVHKGDYLLLQGHISV